MNENWYPIATIARRERTAAEALAAASIETIAPRILAAWYNGFKWVEREQPMFPGYIFGRFDIVEDWHTVTRAQGGKRFVKFANSYPVIEDEFIDELLSRTVGGFVMLDGQQSEAIAAYPKLEQDKHVRILDGPFSGCVGKFDRIFKKEMSGDDRIIVLLEMFGAQREVALNRSEVQVLAY